MTIAPESIPKVATSPRGLRHLFAMLSASRVSSVGRRERDVLMHALFATAAELAHHADEDAVLAHICRAVVDASSRIKLAWIWTGAPDAREVQPRIYAGPAAEYARRLVIERNWVTQRRQVFRAMQASAHDNARVFRPSPYAPRRGSKAEFGFDSALALPIRLADPARRAVLVVYADDAHYFPQVGRAPFIAFAHLAEVALEQVRRSAETRAIVERDPLTGLPDQRGAETHFAQAWRGLHEHQTFSLLMIDMDQFEHVNKRLGRASGDRVLRDTGLAITAALRAQDKLARWNGAAFVALLPGASAGTARRVAERVQYAVLERGWQTGVPRLSCSIGVVSGPERFADWESMVAHVEGAMRSTRMAGRDRLVVT